MVNRNDYLEMAAAKYAGLIFRALDPDLGHEACGRERAAVPARPIRLAAAALLRRLADALQSEGEAALAEPLAVTR